MVRLMSSVDIEMKPKIIPHKVLIINQMLRLGGREILASFCPIYLFNE